MKPNFESRVIAVCVMSAVAYLGFLWLVARVTGISSSDLWEGKQINERDKR
jgi:hypothetical protein